MRQQYNFSPLGAIREMEDYRINLDGVVQRLVEQKTDYLFARPSGAPARPSTGYQC